MSLPFTDQELLAYADERLSTSRSAMIEQSLRDDECLVSRLSLLLSQRDQGDQSLGQVWRQDRLSCPSRAVWGAFVAGRLGDGFSQYLRFHLETIGCRLCAANLADLSRPDQSTTDQRTESERRTRKFFQSSAGSLRPDHPADAGT